MFAHSSDRRLLAAVLASAVLHAAGLASADFLRNLHRPLAVAETLSAPRLEAHLLPVRTPETDERLLKNTLAVTPAAKPVSAHSPIEAPAAAPSRAAKTASKQGPSVMQEARRKLAAHMFYPPAAIAQGLEGEVRVLLKLAPDGTILEASIAAGSGHELLDQAALNAALAMRRVPVAGAEELILPVVFKLQ